MLHGPYTESLQLLPQALSFAERGYRVVLPDLRAHGQSGGRYVTFGVRERRDVAALLERLRAQDAVVRPLVLYGTSLGASTALQAVATGVEADRVVAVAAAADARDVILESGPELLPGIVRPLLSAGRLEVALEGAERLADFSFAETEIVPMAARVDLPVLLVHARRDELVPFEHSSRLHRALPCSTLQPVDRHGHATLLFDVRPTVDSVSAWLDRERPCAGSS